MTGEKEIIIDCLGDMCPLPLIRLKQQQKLIAQGKQVKLLTDHSCVSESVKDYCNTLSYRVEVREPVNGVWEFYIKK